MTDHCCCCCRQVATRTCKTQYCSPLCMRHPRQWETLRHINNKQPIHPINGTRRALYIETIWSVTTHRSRLVPTFNHTILYTTNNTTCYKLIANQHCLLSTASFETKIKLAPNVPQSWIDRLVHFFLPRANTKTTTLEQVRIFLRKLIVFLWIPAPVRHIHRSTIQRQKIQ